MHCSSVTRCDVPRAWAATILAVAAALCACGRTDIGAACDHLRANRAPQDRVAVILAADHGGTGNRHSYATDPFNYTIPFYVVGPGIAVLPATRTCTPWSARLARIRATLARPTGPQGSPSATGTRET
jgi:hypothetical protein